MTDNYQVIRGDLQSIAPIKGLVEESVKILSSKKDFKILDGDIYDFLSRKQCFILKNGEKIIGFLFYDVSIFEIEVKHLFVENSFYEGYSYLIGNFLAQIDSKKSIKFTLNSKDLESIKKILMDKGFNSFYTVLRNN